jgi:hypothetical protein
MVNTLVASRTATRRRSAYRVDITLQFATLFYVPRQTLLKPQVRPLAGIRIGNETYYEAKEVLNMVGVSRQTLWIWRKDKLIPAGSRFRNRIVFSKEETAVIATFAAKLEPVELADTKSQLKLPLA